MSSAPPGIRDRGLPEDPDAVSNILLKAPTHDEVAESVCGELLTVTDPAETNALWVTFTRSPDRCVEAWTRHATEPPREAGIVIAGERTRAAASGSGTDGQTPEIGIETIDDPGNLTELGVRITEFLEGWSAESGHSIHCFDSLTALLQYAELQQVYQFLHTLTSQVEKVGGVAHYHIDPAAHDDQTVATLRPLFDKRITVEDGDVTVT